MTATLDITVHHWRDRLVVDLAGVLDPSTTSSLIPAVADALTDEINTIELDVKRLSFCNTTGVATLIGLHRAASAEGKNLWLRHVTQALAQILTIAGHEDGWHA